MKTIIIVMLAVQAGIFLVTAWAIAVHPDGASGAARPIWSSFAIALARRLGHVLEHRQQPCRPARRRRPDVRRAAAARHGDHGRPAADPRPARAGPAGLTPRLERRLLQAAVAVACLSPFWFGLKGMIEGPAMLAGVEPGASAADLDQPLPLSVGPVPRARPGPRLLRAAGRGADGAPPLGGGRDRAGRAGPARRAGGGRRALMGAPYRARRRARADPFAGPVAGARGAPVRT